MSQVTAQPIDLNELFRGAQAHNLNRLSSGFDHDARQLNLVGTTKIDEVDLKEAAAAEALGNAGMGKALAANNAGTANPRPDVTYVKP